MGNDKLEERLRTHVLRLARDIGERNVFLPQALQAAASYLERQWTEQGYAVETLTYEVSGVLCANLEVTRRGGVRKGEILLIGAHYDSVMGSPGANDNASGIAALLSWSDHRSFWRQGYRAVMITDTAFYRYRHYHRNTDTPDKLNYPALAVVTHGLTSAFAALAQQGI